MKLSQVSIENTIIFRSIVLIFGRWHLDTERKMLFVIHTRRGPQNSSNLNRKPHSYFLLGIRRNAATPSSSSFPLLCVLCSNSTGTTLIHYGHTQLHIYTRMHALYSQYSNEWRRFVYFAAFTTTFRVYLWNFVGDRWACFTLVRLSLADVTCLIHK